MKLNKVVIIMIPNGYREYIKEQIDNYIHVHKKLPQKTDLKKFAIEPLIFEFGNWRNALIELGYLKNETPETAFQSLQELQDELHGLPSYMEAKEAGIDTKILIQKYGTWKNVKNELKKHTTKTYTMKKINEEKFNEKIKQDEEKIIVLTKEKKKIPTAKDLMVNNIDMNRILKKYITWNNAKEQLHLYDIYEEIVISQIKELYLQEGKKPSLSVIAKHHININPLITKYGSWTNACKHLPISTFNIDKFREYVLEEMKKQRKLPSLSYLKRQGFDEKELLKIFKNWHNVISELKLDIEEEKMLAEDIQHLCNKLQHIPTLEELKEYNLHYPTVFKKYHGWENFKKKYGIKVMEIHEEINTEECEKKIKLVEKIIGKFPTKEEAKDFDIDVEKLVKKYGSWDCMKEQVIMK